MEVEISTKILLDVYKNRCVQLQNELMLQQAQSVMYQLKVESLTKELQELKSQNE